MKIINKKLAFDIKNKIRKITRKKTTVKIDNEKLITDGTFEFKKDDKFGDFYLKQTPNATCLLTYKRLEWGQNIPLTDNKMFIDGCRDSLNKNNKRQGLVEVVNTKTKKGRYCAYSIIKEAMEPFGTLYILTIQVAYEDFIINIHGEFKEEGMTGERDNLVAILYDKAGKMKIDKNGMQEGWFKDPYDEKYTKGIPMNQSELAKFDDSFPQHPLSEARSVINIVINNN